VRIERIAENGQTRAIVYIAGTRDFGLHPSADPWDMTSNMQALSDTRVADSERAVRDAMEQASIDAATPVTLVGHSQGGLIASRLAASDDFSVTDVVLAGSPSHQVSMPERIRVTAFEHVDDVIPALSGPVLGAAATVFVRQPAPTASAASQLPAHDLKAYIGTARTVDRLTDPVLDAPTSKPSSAGTSAEVTCSAREYTARRQIGQAISSATTGEK
jgi:pimeloyl-ACP methyl ester carboxylesterase